MFYVYAIYNQIRDKIYIGHTVNLEERIDRHNKKLPSKVKSFTSKNNGMWKLIHKESFLTRGEAMIREKQLKSSRGRNFIRNLISCKKITLP